MTTKTKAKTKAKTKTLAILIAAGWISAFGAACEQDGPAEELGEQIDESAEKAEEELRQFGKKMEDAAEGE